MDVVGIKIHLKRKLDFESEPRKIPKLVDPLDSIFPLHDVKDTSGWTPEHRLSIINHKTWSNNESIMAIVKIYISIRTVYHGDDILTFMYSTVKRTDSGCYGISKNSLFSLLFRGATEVDGIVLVPYDTVAKTFCDVYNDMIRLGLVNLNFGNGFNMSKSELNIKVLNVIVGE